jgi:hypothetical protein
MVSDDILIINFKNMGSVLSRNRFWWYRSLYDDYCGREIRLTFGLASLIWLPHYWYFKSLFFTQVGHSFE